MDEKRDQEIKDHAEQDPVEEKLPEQETVEQEEKAADTVAEGEEAPGVSPVDREPQEVNVETEEGEKTVSGEEDASSSETETEAKGEEKETPEAGEEAGEKMSAGKAEITVEEVDYSVFSVDKLLARLDLLLSERPVQEIREDVEHIKVNFYKKIHQEIEEKKKHFLEEGGDPLEFKPAPDPREERFKELLKVYRHKKSVFNKEQEHQKQKNLEEKYQIIEEIKDLVNRKESIHKTFQEFRELQEKWRNTGLVPQQYVNDLWETYHYHVEKFYDYIKLNRELRDLDLKKNMEAKIRLCEQAEQLMLEPDIVGAFKTLQKYHEQWREIGPVPKEQKSELWERFKEATRKFNKKYQAYFQEIKEIQKKNLEQKVSLAEKAEEIAGTDLHNHREWEEKSQEIRELQKMWKTIGFAPRKQNNAIYERFRKACDLFFNRKREYYAANKEAQMNNLQLKTDPIIQAEALQDSTEWKKTTEDLINLQKKWKEIGPVPRKHSDVIWKRFRAACDTFFNKKDAHFKEIHGDEKENLVAKNALIEQIEKYVQKEDGKESVADLKVFQDQWVEIGFVPIKNKNDIQERYRTAINNQFDALNIDAKERDMARLRVRLDQFIESPNANKLIFGERNKLVIRIKKAETDIQQLENNIGFFSSGTAKGLLKEYENKIEVNKKNLEALKSKVKLIDKYIEE